MADHMEIDPPEEQKQEQLTKSTTQPQSQQPQQQTQPTQPKKKKTPSSSSSSTKELTSCTIKSPPFAYVHLSTVSISLSSSPAQQTDPATSTQIIDPLQVRSYCTAALRQFLGETGASIVPDILLIRRGHGHDGASSTTNITSEKGRETNIYLRLPRQDLGTFAAAITAFPGLSTTTSESGMLLLQVQSCGDWLGSLIGRAEERDIWGL